MTALSKATISTNEDIEKIFIVDQGAQDGSDLSIH